MENVPVSPPKCQRNILQEIMFSDGNHYLQRNANSVKKKLRIEQENYDSSNFLYKSSIKKFGALNKKTPIECSLFTRGFCAEKNCTDLMTLPCEVHLEILKFLHPQDIIKSIQYINKHWCKVSNDKRLWEVLEKSQKLSMDLKYIKQQCLVERRSKGKLFKAFCRLDEQTVMVRKIHLAIANAGFDDGLPTSVLREISYLSNLDHNNISKIKEIEVTKDFVQICSEFHDYNLKEYMKLHLFKADQSKSKNAVSHGFNLSFSEYKTSLNEYKMPLRNIKLITYQILKGLCYLHHQGFIHRNLKSDNIFINLNGDIKIGDFSLSKLITIPHIPYTPEDPKDRERSGREARRLWYRPPELLLRKNIYSFEVDVWAFGCLLGELALNEPLFNGDTEIEQLFKIFRMIGSPNSNMWNAVSDNSDFKLSFPDWEAVYFPLICYPEGSQEFDHISKVLIPNREKSFKRLKSLGNIIGAEGLDLLWSCLMLNPQMRPHTSSLLSHKFFDEVRNEVDLKYMGVTCCQHRICENSGLYTIPNMLDCHLISYFHTLKKNEIEFKPDSGYLNQQPIITEHMRCILIDWLIDVSVHFDVMNETLHYCTNYIDRVLSKMKIDKSKLQLIGVTCMKIADVCHERSKEYYKQENANEYDYITADEYTATQLIDMEKTILNILGFKLNAPHAMHFLKIYVALLEIPEQITIIAMFLVDLMLMSHQILEFNYSLIASAALFLACKSGDYKVDPEKMKACKDYLDVYNQKDFERCVSSLKCVWNAMKTNPSYINFDAVYNKYQVQYNFFARTLTSPTFYHNDLQDWFYTRF